MSVALHDRIGVEEIAYSLGERREEFLSFLLRRVKDHAAAEDLLQVAYTRAIGKLETLHDAGMARAWFYRILRNIVVDFYRKSAAESRLMEPMAATFDAPALKPESRNICRCMDRAVEGLRPEYAQILREVELGEGKDATLEAYARRQGITAGNAAVRAFRARKAMVRELKNTCGSCAGAGCFDCTCSE